MKRKILVTGSNGQLGLSLRQRIDKYPNLTFEFTDIMELDITDKAKVQQFFANNKFRYIINCAAYTAVDKAEDEADKAYFINSIAIKYLSQASKSYDTPLIHISTDYVFDGKSKVPYTEESTPNPQSIYGKTKYESEKQIQKHCKQALILRTSWLYSEYGHNFVKTILRLANEKDEIKVISDQKGTPTYAGDLAEAILEIVNGDAVPEGISLYHFSNEGQTNWYDFAKAIIEQTGAKCDVTPVKTSEYTFAKAPRPYNSLFSKEKFKTQFNPKIPEWKDSLAKCIANIN